MFVLVRLVNVAFVLYGLGLMIYAMAPLPKAEKFERPWRASGRLFNPLLDLLRNYVEPIRLSGKVLDLTPLFALVLVAVAWAIVHYILTGSVTASA